MSFLGLAPWDRLEYSKGGQPYESQAALLTDFLAWLDFLLETALERAEAGACLPGALVSGGALRPALDTSRPNPERPDGAPVAQALEAGQQYILERALSGVQQGRNLPLVKLFTQYKMTAQERLALLLALAPLEHRKYGSCYAKLQGANGSWPTDLLVRTLYGLYGEEGEALSLSDPASPLRRTLFQPDPEGGLRLRRRVWLWLHGSVTLDWETALYCRWLEPTQAPLLVHQAQYATLRAQVERERPALIQLSGRPGSGRQFFLRHLSADLGRPVLSVDLETLCAVPLAERDLILDRVALELHLTGGLLHLHGWPEGDHGEAEWVLARMAELSPLLFLSTQRPRALTDQRLPPMVLLSLDELSLSQRRALWQAQGERVPFDETLDLALCAAQYRLTPGAIARACEEALEAAHGQGQTAIAAAQLQRCIYRGSTGRLEGLATRIPPTYRWEDLMLPPEQKEVLALARDRLRLRTVVDVDWGFGAKYAYGRGLSIMFSGPPGTGKTMGAQVLAREVGLELFRVDMSRLTSKYIGESEKNISRIFDAAQDSNAILFFDEADSLFAKRTEVQNSNDRYANAEVSFLLQKMEAYEGMCILSTNLARNFDTAFFRRITFVVRFQMPAPAQRLQLWQAAFPDQAPIDPKLDLKQLADSMELSGSSIKSVVYNAACLAAAEGEHISRNHVTQALKLENAKMGKLFLPEGL